LDFSIIKSGQLLLKLTDFATEPSRYPLELFQRVITVSLETLKIVNLLPRLDITIN
jgi:hypothetical protein